MTTRTTTTRTIVFAAPIGLSAFLLFTVEPLVGRLALPIFGGTPAVWATTLFFFQAVLLAGYLYAHVSVSWFGRWGPASTRALRAGMGAALVAPARVASIGVDGYRQRSVSSPPAVIGLPAFILTTTTPLLSSWFANVRRRRRRSVLAVRPEQRWLPAGTAGLPARHRTTTRADRPAWHLV